MMPSSRDEISLPEARRLLAVGIEAIDAHGGSFGRIEALRGEEFGRFMIAEPLGIGATGSVYRATDRDTGEEVAVKIVCIDRAAAELLLRFRQEARILTRLRHPNIARIHDSSVVENQSGTFAYLAMELVSGPDFGEWCRSPGRSFAERIEALAKIADAMHHAHVKGIIHRDLKPSNIRMSAGGHPKILDFGAAHVADPGLRVTGLLTASGGVLGTLAYMSPDQLGSGTDEADLRFDIYALGVLLFESLAGRLPIPVSGLPLLRAIDLVRSAEPPPIRTVEPSLPRDIELVVAKALAKDPESRYSSAEAFAADLRRVVAGEPVSIRVPGLFADLSRYARRHPKACALAGVAALIALVMLVVLQALLHRANRAESAALRGWSRWIDYTQALNDIEVSNATRHRLASYMKDWSDDLSVDRERRSDEWQVLAARTLDVISDVKLAAGDIAAALDCRFRAFAIRRDLADRNPRDLQAARDLSRAMVKIGDCMKARSDFSGAGAWYGDAYALDRRLLQRHPGNLDLLDDEVWSLIRLAGNAEALGQNGEAVEYRGQFDRASSRLLEASPNRRLSLFARAQALIILCGPPLFSATERSAAARRADEAYRLARRLCDDDADKSDHRRILHAACLASAAVAIAEKNVARAEQFIGEAEGIARRVLRNDPSSPLSQWYVAAVERLRLDLVCSLEPEALDRQSEVMRRIAELSLKAFRLDSQTDAHRRVAIGDAFVLLDLERRRGDTAGQASAVAALVECIPDPVDSSRLPPETLIALGEVIAFDEVAADPKRAVILLEAASAAATDESLAMRYFDLLARVFDAAAEPAKAGQARRRLEEIRGLRTPR